MRRVRLFFDKLSFPETIGIYKAFRNYILSVKNDVIDTGKPNAPQREEDSEVKFSNRLSMDMDLSSISDGMIQRNMLSPQFMLDQR